MTKTKALAWGGLAMVLGGIALEFTGAAGWSLIGLGVAILGGGAVAAEAARRKR